MATLRRLLTASGAGALACAFGIPALASAATPLTSAGGDVPPSAVETFSYPAAAQIWSNQKIKLIRGDGHIVLADCDATGSQIKVLTVTDDDLGTRATYCFQATASTGYLALEVPRTFYLTTSDHPVAATLTADGRSSTVTVPKNDYQPVGEGTVGGAKSTLVELRIAG